MQREKIADTLKSHALKYPLMQPADLLKLLYQESFGNGHLSCSEEEVLKRIDEEYKSSHHSAASPHLEILGRTARIYLDSRYSEDELRLIARIFSASAKRFPKGYHDASETERSDFLEKIQMLRRLSAEGAFSFTADELDNYLSEYQSKGFPPLRHSESYRETYRPSYRVVDSMYIRILPLVCRLAFAPAPTVVAIDGRAASGKTTTSQLLADIFDVDVIHMDDFFLPLEMRTSERLTETGGNIHYERFSDEVVKSLRSEKEFSYRRYDCQTSAFHLEKVTIGPKPIIICEGSYSLHPTFGKYYDIAVFSDISPSMQEERILKRNGGAILKMFKDRWIPMEEEYFNSFKIKEKCDFII